MSVVKNKQIVLGDREFDAKIIAESMELACLWMTDVAQVRDENDPTPRKHKHKSWQGALRGEYRAATKAWSFFCPVWHTGQAVKALAMACKITGVEKLLEAARSGADFIVKNQIDDRASEDYGLILAYEDHPDKVNTSAVLEYCLKMQFVNPADPDLKGAILEKVLPPDGTDDLPYHIRDLGTIFFVQSAAKLLEKHAKSREVCGCHPKT